jgi:tetratricopeptide (TPR) repeat protein
MRAEAPKRPPWRSTLQVVALLLATGIAAPAGAQPEANPETKARARASFQKGKAAYELGRFHEALKHYEKAYKVWAHPAFHFNIGQCYRNIGKYDKAIFSFRQYLRKLPNARNRGAVETLIDELEVKAEEQRRIDEENAQNKVPEFLQPGGKLPGKTPPPPKPFYKQWWFWVPVAVVVVAGGATGGYFAARSRDPSLPNSDLGVWDLSR